MEVEKIMIDDYLMIYNNIPKRVNGFTPLQIIYENDSI